MQRLAGSRVIGAAAIGLAALAFGAPLAPAAAAGAPAVGAPAHARSSNASQLFYVATTSASAVSVQFTQQPAASIITQDLVNDSLGYTATAFDTSQGSEAQAASVYPGTLVVQGPSLLCSEGVLPFACPVKPPAYPLLADAQYPQHPHATAGSSGSSTGKGPFTAQAAQATADTGPASATADTDTGSGGLLAGTPVAISVGSESSHTSVAVVRHVLTVSVVSKASDISIGGLLHIGSVTGKVVQRLVAGRKPVDSPTVTISDVTVAGQRASIGNDGLQIAGRRGPALLRKLASQHITVEPVTVSRKDTGRGARSDVTGLTVTSSIPVKHTPYIPNPVSSVPPFDQVPITGVDLNGNYLTTVQLGAAGSAAAVQRQADVGLGGVAPPVQPVHSAQPVTPAGTSSGGGTTVTAGSGGGVPATQPSTAPAPGSSPQVAAPRRQAGGFLDAFGLDLSHFYLVLALGAAALFIGWRVRAMTRHRDWPNEEPA